ncbi:MAG: peptidase [Cyanobacteria bacterium RYN_339]|nr:peptidase [Cyanobacteria bacterium RYN_339]
MRSLVPALLVAMLLPSLAGCGASRSLPGGSPVLKPAATNTVQGRTAPVAPAPVGVTTTKGTTGAFFTSTGAAAPTFAPRGDHLAYVTPSKGVLLAAPDGSNPQLLAGSRPGDRDPAWSPLGDAVVVVRAGAKGGSALVKISLVGGLTVTLYEAPGALHQPACIPGGAGVVFVEEQTTSVLMRLDAPGAKAVALWKGALAASPAVAPNAQSVTFERGGADAGLARVAMVGGLVETLKTAGLHARRPSFSGTGNSLAYVADDGVYVGQPDGTQSKRIAAGNGYESLCWQPGLPRLVVAATQGSRTDLQRVDLPAR